MHNLNITLHRISVTSCMSCFVRVFHCSHPTWNIICTIDNNSLVPFLAILSNSRQSIEISNEIGWEKKQVDQICFCVLLNSTNLKKIAPLGLRLVQKELVGI